MVIDKNTTLINNFSKGMNTDTSDAYLEDGAYRMVVNLRYTTSVGSNSGELHMIEGCTHLIDGSEGQIVKATTQLRDKGIIVTQASDGTEWRVYTVYNAAKHCVARVRAEKDRVINKDISVVCRYEDEDNQKLYIADGAGPIIVVQLGIDEDKEINVLDPDQWTPLNPMLAYPSALLDIPKFSGLITGSLKSGVYQYAYLLYKKHAGQSEISVPTKMIPLHKGDPSLSNGNANQTEGYEKDVLTDKGIKITIDIDDQKLIDTFDSIYIYRIHYKEVGLIPDIDLVYDDNIPSNGSIDFSDTGIKSISVLSLEEYNAITGVHIIPSVIEAKDDFLFAANIDNDAPIYEKDDIKDWKASDYNIQWEFITATLTGDTCNNEDCIDIKDNLEQGLMLQLLLDVGQDKFVGEVNDENKTYANAYTQYALKSLRRGETYRYGIIFYDEDGNASAVKHLADVPVPEWSERPTFRVENGKMEVLPIGVQFLDIPMPPSAKKYEIVRCGRDYSDISTITQCVLSRPIQRLFRQTFDDAKNTEVRPQSNYPLTPTGFVTVQDYISWIPNAGLKSPININVSTAWNRQYTNVASNMDIKKLDRKWDITGNKNIFLIISPEYCYQSESMKEMLSNVELDIQPLTYIYPHQEIIYEGKTWSLTAEVGGHFGTLTDEVKADYYNIGNKYANYPITGAKYNDSNNAIAIDSTGGTLLSYYKDRSSIGEDILFGNNDFLKLYANIDKNRFAYIKLYEYITTTKDTVKLSSVSFPLTLSWDDFATPSESYNLTYVDKVCAIGGTNFVNWVSNGLFGLDHSNETFNDSFTINEELLGDAASIVGAMMGPGGKCMVGKVDSDLFANIEDNKYFGTYLCNIKRKSTPYGGSSQVAKENSTYRSFGDLFDVYKDGKSPIIFDGDCYILPFEYVSQHKWYHPYLPSARNACIVYSIPMETNINMPYSCGYGFSKHIGESSISNVQDLPANVNNIFTQDRPLYAYDTVNNTVPTAKTLIAESNEEDMYDTNMDYRVYHSDKKSNNERTDSWLMYRTADYIDVDNRYGAITGLRKFNNTLVFWQEAAAGILQVNERAQITDDSNLPLILGTGGVLGRYDYINTKNGMREGEFADTQSDNILYWWDHDKKQILSYTSGVMAQELSKIKFVQSFFSNCKDVDDPILFFDKLNNEAVFKVSSEGSVVFNEGTGCFTGVYTINPSGAIILPSSLLLVSNDAAIKTWNSLNDKGVTGLDGTGLLPKLKYVVNSNSLMTKTFDNTEFGGRVYRGGDQRTYVDNNPLKHISFDFYTPMKLHGNIKGDKIDNTEYNFRFAIPRAEDAIYGGRLRGKTMEVVMLSDTNNYDFSLLFILTKYRISWA